MAFPYEIIRPDNAPYFRCRAEARQAGFEGNQTWSVCGSAKGLMIGPPHCFENLIGYIATRERHNFRRFFVDDEGDLEPAHRPKSEIWVVVAEHPFVPGMALSAHRTLKAATEEAVSLTNDILRDLKRPPKATVKNWGKYEFTDGYVAIRHLSIGG